ncbi:hypothetical protein SKAU_G00292660 [Synaphobranchus kaupii]|uniref:Uncharacterized protein n=1 Tax=Synaphobranchus kaupii TaxID=118154 RepID=A0A9Q1IMF5_SYNKA|nr:hypothetical protein SKAU_G00292660 [Synaphobranchus kaupii]
MVHPDIQGPFTACDRSAVQIKCSPGDSSQPKPWKCGRGEGRRKTMTAERAAPRGGWGERPGGRRTLKPAVHVNANAHAAVSVTPRETPLRFKAMLSVTALELPDARLAPRC